MARIKYGPDITPLVNEHSGFVFQRHASGQSMTTSKSNDRFRNVNQSKRQQNLMKAIRYWRTMSVVIKLAWSDFAAAYPQPSKRNPAFFLSGYQLFLKRSHYCFLNHGTASDFMDAPVLAELPAPEIEFKIEATNNTLDVTQFYINNFGILPKVGQYLLIRIYPMAVASGQFFAPLEATVEVEQVFVDGLFVSFNLNANTKGIVFSVYLSKIFHRSVKYIGTKVRYMGCFTPKTFIELTDTDNDYAGQAGKVPTVKETEDGLEFADPGGGGLDCETLANCELIQDMLAQINANSTFISLNHNTSVPSIRFGLLYNWYALNNPLGLTSSPAWVGLTLSQIKGLRTYLGGTAIAGCKVRIMDTEFWTFPNACATNSAKTNCKGGGERSSVGVFQNMLISGFFWSSGERNATQAWGFILGYNSNNIGTNFATKSFGRSLFIRQPAIGIADGIAGTYFGNDGRVYRTITIDEFEYVADPLAETEYRNHSLIPEITDNTDWANDVDGALSAFDNDWANV